MINGIYQTKNDREGYDVKIRARETDKSYIFELLENNSRFSPPHIDMLFEKSNKITMKKKNSQHAILLFDDGFTIYPYRDGIPYFFELVS